MRYKIPFIRPNFPDSAVLASDYESIVESNWYTNFGPYEQRFRKKIADYISSDVVACTTANATLALEICIKATLNKGSDKTGVLVPSFTFASGPQQLISNGFTPIFLDIDENLQPNINQAIEYLQKNQNKVAGILLGNTFGVGNPQITAWEELATEYDLPLIIDSAAGFGSKYTPNERIGARGTCEVFSFHATKPFAIGEGGAIVSRDYNFIQRCVELSNFGFNNDKQVKAIGINAKLQELNCAIGLRQLEHFDERLAKRQKILANYKRALTVFDYSFQANDALSTVPFVSALAPNTELADRALQSLASHNVEARNYYAPLHFFNTLVEKSQIANNLATTEDVASRIISLPLYEAMVDEEVQYVINAIHEA